MTTVTMVTRDLSGDEQTTVLKFEHKIDARDLAMALFDAKNLISLKVEAFEVLGNEG